MRRRSAGVLRAATPFLRAALAEIVERGARTGRLRFSVAAAEAIPSGEVVFLCVGPLARVRRREPLVVGQSACGIALHLSPPRPSLTRRLAQA